MALDYRKHLCGDDPSERKTGCRKERAKLRFGAFATADHQHEQFHKTDGTGGRINDAFDQKEDPTWTDDAARVAKDFGVFVVRPIVNDALHQVGVGTLGHGVEETTAGDLTAGGHIACQDIGSTGHDLW